jgi:hypothetical protein
MEQPTLLRKPSKTDQASQYVYCNAETRLYVNERPVCVKCDEATHQVEEPPAPECPTEVSRVA